MQTPITTSVQSYIKSSSAYKGTGSDTRLLLKGSKLLAMFLKQITKIGNNGSGSLSPLKKSPVPCCWIWVWR